MFTLHTLCLFPPVRPAASQARRGPSSPGTYRPTGPSSPPRWLDVLGSILESILNHPVINEEMIPSATLAALLLLYCGRDSLSTKFRAEISLRILPTFSPCI